MRQVFWMLALTAFTLAACAGQGLPQYADLPIGNPARGAALFSESINGAPSCTSCHVLQGVGLSAPSFEGYGAVAGERVSGLSAGEYTLQSIVQPAVHLVSGYTNVMYNQYAQRLNPQQIADLIAYLLTL